MSRSEPRRIAPTPDLTGVTDIAGVLEWLRALRSTWSPTWSFRRLTQRVNDLTTTVYELFAPNNHTRVRIDRELVATVARALGAEDAMVEQLPHLMNDLDRTGTGCHHEGRLRSVSTTSDRKECPNMTSVPIPVRAKLPHGFIAVGFEAPESAGIASVVPTGDGDCAHTIHRLNVDDFRLEAVPAVCQMEDRHFGSGDHGSYRTIDDVARPEDIEEVSTHLGPATVFIQENEEATNVHVFVRPGRLEDVNGGPWIQAMSAFPLRLESS